VKKNEKIGEGLVRKGALSREQLEEVLRLQAEGDQRLFGQIAVSKHYLTRDKIQEYLQEKKRVRSKNRYW